MASQIDEFLAKKKEQTTLLDLHNCTANSKEELRKLIEKVPEFKIKPEKKPDDIKIKEKKFKFKLPKKESKKPFPFAEPTPSEMKEVSLEELYYINIPWKMLTSLRPKSKIDEEYFSRQVELGKATLKTRNLEKKTPCESFLRKKKNASGGVESKFVSCKECGIEFCTGNRCKIFDYDSFKRVTTSTIQVTSEQTQEQPLQEKKFSKRKSLIKGSKIKTRDINESATTMNKNMSTKNNKIINVKTNIKNSPNNTEKVIVKSKESLKSLKEITSKKNINIQNNTNKTKEILKKKSELLKNK